MPISRGYWALSMKASPTPGMRSPTNGQKRIRDGRRSAEQAGLLFISISNRPSYVICCPTGGRDDRSSASCASVGFFLRGYGDRSIESSNYNGHYGKGQHLKRVNRVEVAIPKFRFLEEPPHQGNSTAASTIGAGLEVYMARQIVAVRMDGGTEHWHIAGAVFVETDAAKFNADSRSIADLLKLLDAKNDFFTRDYAGDVARVVIVTSLMARVTFEQKRT